MNEVLKASLPSLISAALPTLMVLIGILLNRNDINRLDGRISSLESKMEARFSAQDAKMDARFALVDAKIEKLSASLDGKIESRSLQTDAKLERLSELVHQGILNLNVRSGEHDTRISLLEEKANRT